MVIFEMVLAQFFLSNAQAPGPQFEYPIWSQVLTYLSKQIAPNFVDVAGHWTSLLKLVILLGINHFLT